MKLKITIILFFLGLGLSNSFGQKITKTKGQAQIRQESDMSYNEAAEKVIELAKINAIEQAFGTYIEQQTDMLIEDGITSFNTIGSTKVKGEWIETLGEPVITTRIRKEKTQYGMQDVTWLSCKIKGKVREIGPRAKLEYEILNAPDIHARTTDFINGEQLYIYFKSPVDGYISIFLEDDEGVYRLLPYMQMNPDDRNGALVQGDVEYTFFSPSDNHYPKSIVDEMIMTLTKERIEYNYIYIVFSEDKYIKPGLKESFQSEERIIPGSLSKWDFEKWLSNNRAGSTSFQVIKQKISIKLRK